MNSQTNGLALEAVPPLLRWDDGGAVRVGKSRITLDLVVEQYEHGMTPEDMVLAYDTLVLADASIRKRSARVSVCRPRV
jgi:hypothetical protein